MACAKDGTLKDYESTSRTAREYHERQEKQADETIGKCVQGKLTERHAKEALAKQFAADRRGFQNAVAKLENELKSGRSVQSVHTQVAKGTRSRTLSVHYDDGSREDFGLSWQFGGPPSNMAPGQEMMRTGSVGGGIVVEYQRVVDPKTGEEKITTMKTETRDQEHAHLKGRDTPHATKHGDGEWHDRYDKDDK